MYLTDLSHKPGTIHRTNKQKPQKNYNISSTNKDNVSFKGVPLTKVLSTLEGNVILSLATIDVLGMVMPRTLIELNRNKKELGHLNWDAGREMLMNQSLASVGLYLGPGYVFNKVGQKLLESKFNPYNINTKAFTNLDTLKAIELKLKDILRTEALKGTKTIDVNQLRQMLAKGLLEDVRSFSSTAKNPLKISTELIDDVVREVGSSMKRGNVDKAARSIARSQLRQEYRQAFETARASILKEATSKGIANPDMKTVTREAVKKARESIKGMTKTIESANRSALLAKRDQGVSSFIKKFLQKLNPHLRETEVTLAVKGAKPVTTNTGILVRDVFTATDDVVLKAANGSSKVNVDTMRNQVDKVIKSTKTLKTVKALLPFAIILTLLVTLPRFVNWMTKKITGKEEFPGLAGLSNTKDSTGNSKTPDKPANQLLAETKVPSAPANNNLSQSAEIPRSVAFEDFLRRYKA
jgi:hypothetical protein